jgi:hypothetical protein
VRLLRPEAFLPKSLNARFSIPRVDLENQNGQIAIVNDLKIEDVHLERAECAGYFA